MILDCFSSIGELADRDRVPMLQSKFSLKYISREEEKEIDILFCYIRSDSEKTSKRVKGKILHDIHGERINI